MHPIPTIYTSIEVLSPHGHLMGWVLIALIGLEAP